MSHMIKSKCPPIKNLKSLEKACTNLKCKLNTAQKEATFYSGSKIKCDATISVPGTTYQVALMKQADGTYEMHTDSFCRTFSSVVGPQAGKISQHYQIEEHKRIAKANGQEIVSCTRNENTNKIELTIRAK